MSLREQRVQLGAQVALEQPHQRADFGGRPLPVLDRERVERQDLDAEAGGGLDRVAHGVDAGAMPFDARQVALRGPAAVAVHDDGDVRRQPVEVHLARERLVGMAGRNPRQELLKRHVRISSLSASSLIIVHPDQEQALRRRRGARLARASPRRSSAAIDRGCAPAAADLDERPDDGADHVAKEAVAA